MEETNLGTFHKIWGARIKRAQAKLNLTGAQPPKRGGAMAPVAPPPYYPPVHYLRIMAVMPSETPSHMRTDHHGSYHHVRLSITK